MSTIREQYTWLLRELQREQCVLIIGPELLRVNGTAYLPHLQEQLHNSDKEKIPFYYSKDSLFVFSGDMSKASIQGEVVTRLEKIGTGAGKSIQPDETLYKQIAAIPFHLILSVNPDHYLSDTFAKYGVLHRSAYFNHDSSVVTDIESPQQNRPLIYNLFGSQEKDASLVLDYDDLFSLFQKLLVDPGHLPITLKTKLREAKSFLFLGFRFDRWYSQMLLRLLGGKNAIRKYVLESKPDEDTCTFLARQMGITFLGDNYKFFNLLYTACETNNLLRDLVETQNPFARGFFQLVQRGDHGRAMKDFAAYFNGKPQETEATLILARYAEWEKNVDKKTLTDSDAQVSFNQIIYAALELVKTVN